LRLRWARAQEFLRQRDKSGTIQELMDMEVFHMKVFLFFI